MKYGCPIHFAALSRNGWDTMNPKARKRHLPHRRWTNPNFGNRKTFHSTHCNPARSRYNSS